MNNSIIILYKEVGKSPILKKIENSIESFKCLLGGEIDTIPYEDIIIVCKKDREKLQPNIYINTSFSNIDFSMRGNLFITNKDTDNFKSLNNEQISKYSTFLKEESFKYEHFDKNGKYISNTIFEKKETHSIETTLQIILKMQLSIMQLLKKYTNNK